MSRAEPAPTDAAEAPVADASAPGAPGSDATRTVDWSAVRRGCPCATCKAARSGEHGQAPDAADDARSSNGDGAHSPPVGGAQAASDAEAAPRPQEGKGRAIDRPDERPDDLEAGPTHRPDDGIARHLEDLEARLADSLDERLVQRLETLEARLARRPAASASGTRAAPPRDAPVDAAVEAVVGRAGKRLERRVRARLSRLDERLGRLEARLERMEEERFAESRGRRPPRSYDPDTPEAEPLPPSRAAAEREPGPHPRPSAEASRRAAAALGRILEGLEALVADLTDPADLRT